MEIFFVEDPIDLYSIRSIRIWALLKFFFTADLFLDEYTLTLETRRHGLFKKRMFLDLMRVHRMTPYLLGKFAVISVEAERGVALSAPRPRSREYVAPGYEPVLIWLPFVFPAKKAILFCTTVQKAIIRRSIINRQKNF
jgi:hypothetical protein